MERYIGLDVHATSCTLAVVGPSGRKLKCQVVETNGAALVEAVRLVPGQRKLVLEEGTQSAWLYEVLRPHVQELVVTQQWERRRGPKNDEKDAFDLANGLRQGTLRRRVYKDPSKFGRLRELCRAHTMLTRDVVRVQLRLKAVFRGRGVRAAGLDVYAAEHRDAWLGKLPHHATELASTLYEQYDMLSELTKRNRRELIGEVKQHEIATKLETCPGLGWIRVAQIMAAVVTPYRFRTKQQFWSYCGLGVVTRSSSDWVQAGDGSWARVPVRQTRGLNRNHRRELKDAFKGAAQTVVVRLRRGDLYEKYEQLLRDGTKPNLAKVTLARKIAASTLEMWKRGESYRPRSLT
jgi:transposase